MIVGNLKLRGGIMFDNLSEIVKQGDNGDIAAMIKFVRDNDICLASKSEYDIKKRRHTYLQKLVEAKIPFAYQDLAFDYEESGEYAKAIELFEESCKFGNTFSLEHLGKYYFFGDYVKKDYQRAYKLFSEALNYEKYSGIENVIACYPFVAYFFLGEMYRRGLYVKKNLLKASRDYADACWICIQGFEGESDEMVVASYWNGLERLGKFADSQELLDSEYPKNVVEALSMIECVRDWKFNDESLLEKLGLSMEEINKNYEECKVEIKKLYPKAKYIAVNAAKYIIAEAEEFNQVMDFKNDSEAKEYLAEHHDETNGGAEESVKFILNTQSWECLFAE